MTTPQDEPDREDVFKALDEYHDAFGSTVTIIGLGDRIDEVPAILRKAVAAGQPLTDEALLAALGMTPPPDDADI